MNRTEFNDSINLVISGEAGQGIDTASEIITKILHSFGYNVFSTNEYMSRIRGGCNSTLIKVSEEKSAYYSQRIDILFVLDEKAKEHLNSRGRISQDTIIIDAQKSNMYVIGYVSALFKADEGKTLNYLKEKFPKYFDSETNQKNVTAFQNGVNEGENADIEVNINSSENVNGEKLLSGNDALAIGSIAGGVNFLAFYPMSPSTNFSTLLSEYADDFNIISEQVEDEICAINMALGASYAGARSCVSTSGGGFALMCEGVSLAGMLELPVVIHLAQRPAPATGLPTRSAQEDLNLALYSGHGEFARIIFSPATLYDFFIVGQKAFDLAQKYQIPVFILSEQSSLENVYSTQPFNVQVDIKDYFVESTPDYKRYKLSDNPISPMALPGHAEGIVCVDSDEHDETGYITEDLNIRKSMVEKRLKKLNLIKQDIMEPYFIGDENCENLIISWGSNLNVIKAAIKDRQDFALLHFIQVYPLPDFDSVSKYIQGKKLTIVEQNATGQFAQLLKKEWGLDFNHKLLKYNGETFSIEELNNLINTGLTY